MKPIEERIINNVIEALSSIINGKPPAKIDTIEHNGSAASEFRALCEVTNRLINSYAEAGPFIGALARGDLQADPPPHNHFVSPLKQLHSNLRHLTWQTQQVAKGDLNQSVDFLGQFSEAFNSMIGSLKDKRKMEKALLVSEQKYRNLFHYSNDAIFIHDLDGAILDVNLKALNLFEYDKGELLSLKLQDLYLAEQSRTAAQALERIVQDGFAFFEVDFIAKSGILLSGEVSSSIIELDGTEVILSIVRDITARKQAAKALQQAHSEFKKRTAAKTEELEEAKKNSEKASRAKSEFLANMSHELRTPLNHILGFTELVVDKKFGELNEVQEEYLKDVLESGNHLLSLINDILDISKVEAGKVVLEKSDINLKTLLESSLKMVREKSMKHGIGLSLEFDEYSGLIMADERKLKQILYNLLSNAVKFTPDGGSITLSASISNSKQTGPDSRFPVRRPAVLISVADTGIGLRQNDLSRIFNPFEQVDNSSSRKYPGTGLGLALTKNLVGLHGGEIRAYSNGEGQGSVFQFTIPQ